jgi:two-component system chemotaxis response regulator CheY
MRTLVAEDDETCRVLLQTLLSAYGECNTVLDGKESVSSVAAARQEHRSYDLICMDLLMPGIDGLQAVREIRRLEAVTGTSKTAKIIMTTADASAEKISAAAKNGCDAYIVKPIDIEKLRAELKRLGLG